MLVCRVEVEKDIKERGGLFAKLNEDGREESTGILFSSIFEIKKEVGDMCCTSFGDAFNVLNNRRAIVVMVGYAASLGKTSLIG
jgi:hypothetical protein